MSRPELLLLTLLRMCLVWGILRLLTVEQGVLNMGQPVVLQDLLRQKHWQAYRTFCIQYDKAARSVDASLVGTYPSRPQLHRWQSGDLKGLPYPHHCLVLEAMFPGTTVDEMFKPLGERSKMSELVELIEDGLDSPDSAEWRRDALAQQAVAPTGPSSPLTINRSPDDGDHQPANRLARSLWVLSRRMRLSEAEVSELARLGGNAVDLELECCIDIAPDGWASVTYVFALLNLTSRPLNEWSVSNGSRLRTVG